MTIVGLTITPGLLALGLIEGMTYGVLAVGLVLVYRTSRVINFAHGEIGAFGAAFLGLAITNWGFPYWAAFPVAIIVSAGAGALTEVAVIRRLRTAPKLMSLVATLGVASFLLGFSSVVNSNIYQQGLFPQPAGVPTFRVGLLLVTPAYSTMLLGTPVVAVALALFLRRSRFGLGLRAASTNPDRARMAGISAARMSTVAWAISGAVAAYTAVLIIPTSGFLSQEILGPTLLLRALVPAVIARMSTLPLALVAGLATGLIDQILIFNNPTSGVSEVVLFGVVVVALLLQARRGSREEERQDWAVLQPWPALPWDLRRVWLIRNLGRLTLGAGFVVAVALGFLVTNSAAVTLIAIVSFSLIGLSLSIVTGLSGQLSLGQFALAGVGATASVLVVSRTPNLLLGLAAAAVVTAAASMLIGLPSQRVRGLLLGVITLSFALAARRWILAQDWALGFGISPDRPSVGPVALDLTKRYYLYALVVLALGLWLAGNVWRGGIGLRLRALRDNEDQARAFSISAFASRSQSHLIAGALAGMGGAVYAHLYSRISPENFDVTTSINVVALSVLGGIGILAGPILGALYIIGVPSFLPLDSAGLAATSLGWLVLILYFPSGVAQLISYPRAKLIALIARHAGVAATVPEADEEVGVADHQLTLTPARDQGERAEGTVLEVGGLRKRYGGVIAVDGVSLSVPAGQTLGIVGPNGAGKTTLFELLGGFSHPDEGTVQLHGTDVTRMRPEQRARRGLIRSFQDAALFPTMTVLESVELAFERARPTSFVRSLVGMHGHERERARVARELVELMGLSDFATKQVRELSTGTRRITELACVVALQPTVLLLDEPSSGIAQREAEALGDVLLRLRAHLDATFLVIEHDIPLLRVISDRLVAMDAGRVIADGSPDDVLADPTVVKSYLGGDVRTIQRSGRSSKARPARRRRATGTGAPKRRTNGAEPKRPRSQAKAKKQ